MRVGFLGAGLIATFHSKMLRAVPGVERAGVYDPDHGRAAAFAAASGHTVCASAEEVLDGCDAVYVCTWTSEHAALVDAALARRLPVFVEKPLAPDLAGAEAISAAVTRAGIVNQVGLILRRSPAVRWIEALATDPSAGRLMSIVLRDDQFIPIQGHYGSSWRADVAKAGAGTLLEHSIHDVDVLHLLGGPIAQVSAQTASFHGLDRIEDVASAVVRFDSGATATLTSVWHDNLARPSLRRIEVLCERRWIALTGDDWFGPVEWTDSDGTTGRLEGAALVDAVRTAGLVEGPANPDEAFVEAARSGTPAWPDVITAVRAHRVIDAMYASAAAEGAPMRPTTPATTVVELRTEQTYDLRRRVLRNGTPSTDVTYTQDFEPGTVHLGLVLDGAIVGVSTWSPEPWDPAPGEPAVRLRGMAVDPAWQSHGLGGRLVEAGLARAWAGGARIVWASARDPALAFYGRLGFAVEGDMFVDAATGLPHHLIWRRRP